MNLIFRDSLIIFIKSSYSDFGKEKSCLRANDPIFLQYNLRCRLHLQCPHHHHC